MGFFEDVGAHLSAAGNEAYKAAKELAGTGKLGIKIAEESGKLDDMFEMLGRTVYDAKVNEREEDISEAIEEIRAKEQEIADLREELARRRNKKICKACGARTSDKNAFCPTCGAKLD